MKTVGWGSVKFSHDKGEPYIQKYYTWNVQHAEDTTTYEPLTRTQGSSDRLRMLTWTTEIFGLEFGLKPCFCHRQPSSSVLYVALLYVRIETLSKQSYQMFKQVFRPPFWVWRDRWIPFHSWKACIHATRHPMADHPLPEANLTEWRKHKPEVVNSSMSCVQFSSGWLLSVSPQLTTGCPTSHICRPTQTN